MRYRVPSIVEKEQLALTLTKGVRLDGRGIDDFRDINIETGLITKAEGSAKVTIGNTQVIAGVKVNIGSPWPDTPNDGVVTVTSEFVPMASPLFEPGPPSEASVELARIVDRGIRHSEMVDYGKLCIIPGEKVYILFADIYVINHEGNLYDTAALAATAALLTAELPKVEINNGKVTKLDETIPVPICDWSVQSTFAKFNDQLLVDPTEIEESCMSARLSVAIDKKGNVVSMQKGGEAPFSLDEISSCIDRAIKHSKVISKKLPIKE